MEKEGIPAAEVTMVVAIMEKVEVGEMSQILSRSLEPEPEPSPDPGIVPGPELRVDPCLENPEAEGCASEPPVDPCIENPNAEGCEPNPGLVGPTPQPMPPHEGCLLDPTLPECTPPPGGKCPPGTLMNGYGQCYPDKPCPPGYARADNDESGACLPLNTPTPTPTPGGNCDPSYPDKCIPPPPPDLDCNDVSFRNFKVIGSDPHGFDGDNDGIGCEGSGNGSSGRAAVEEMVTNVIPHTQKTVYHPLLQIWIVAMMVFQIMLRFCNLTPID